MSLGRIKKREVQLVYQELLKRGFTRQYAFHYIQANYFYAKKTVYQILSEDLKCVQIPQPSEAYKRVFKMLDDVHLKLNEQGVLKVSVDMPTYTECFII